MLLCTTRLWISRVVLGPTFVAWEADRYRYRRPAGHRPCIGWRSGFPYSSRSGADQPYISTELSTAFIHIPDGLCLQVGPCVQTVWCPPGVHLESACLPIEASHASLWCGEDAQNHKTWASIGTKAPSIGQSSRPRSLPKDQGLFHVKHSSFCGRGQTS